MQLRNLLILFVTFSALTSCISTKQLTYIQEDSTVENDTTHFYQIQKIPYKVQIGDVLSIKVKTTDENLAQLFNPTSNVETANNTANDAQNGYFGGFSVDLHGNIRIPTLGEINVLGFTLDEIRMKIESLLLRDYFKTEASFFVTVKLSGFKFTVTGEVGSPGTKSLFQEQLNILEALANAGEVDQTGNKQDIKIIRQYPEGQKIHSIDLTKASAFESPYFMLKPNDMIYVKPLKQKSLGTGTTAVQSLSTILTVLTLLTTAIILTTR